MPEPEYRQATEKTPPPSPPSAPPSGTSSARTAASPSAPPPTASRSSSPRPATAARCSSATTPARSRGFAALTPDQDDPEEAVMGVWLLRAARRKGVGRELALMAHRLRPRRRLPEAPRHPARRQRARAQLLQRHRLARPGRRPGHGVRAAAVRTAWRLDLLARRFVHDAPVRMISPRKE